MLPRSSQFDHANIETVEKLLHANPTKRYCPICGFLAGKFKPGGTGLKKRENAKCPGCGSLERHRLLWLYLVNVAWGQLPKRKKDLLHIAPERFLVEILKDRPDVNYMSGDLEMSESMLKLDLTDIPSWDAQWDLVLCSHILEHIPDDHAAMREMFRILRPGGLLLVIVPTYGKNTYEDFSITSPEGRRKHFGQEDHVRKYGWDIQGRLTGSGFEVSAWPGGRDLDERILDFSSCGRRVIFTCTRPLD